MPELVKPGPQLCDGGFPKQLLLTARSRRQPLYQVLDQPLKLDPKTVPDEDHFPLEELLQLGLFAVKDLLTEGRQGPGYDGGKISPPDVKARPEPLGARII